MSEKSESDRFLERAREDAEGTELHEDTFEEHALAREREEAEGIEVFENPDATLHPSLLKEGSPGEESLAADDLNLEGDEERTLDSDEA